MNSICTICKDKLEFPHWLPCSHNFCFLCIRRHIEKRNFCPICFKCPFSVSDLRTYEKQNEVLKKMPVILTTNENKLKQELKKLRFDVNVDKHILDQRYKEMCINVEFERFKKVPRNYNTIVRHIYQSELKNKLINKKNNIDLEKINVVIVKIKNEKFKKEQLRYNNNT